MSDSLVANKVRAELIGRMVTAGWLKVKLYAECVEVIDVRSGSVVLGEPGDFRLESVAGAFGIGPNQVELCPQITVPHVHSALSL